MVVASSRSIVESLDTSEEDFGLSEDEMARHSVSL